MSSGRRVQLLQEHVGADFRHVWVYLDDEGNLHIVKNFSDKAKD